MSSGPSRGHISDCTFVVWVVQVEQRRPVLLPVLQLFLLLQLVFIRAPVGAHRQAVLEPEVLEEHVQRDGPTQEAHVEGEARSEGLHRGSGSSLSGRGAD